MRFACVSLLAFSLAWPAFAQDLSAQTIQVAAAAKKGKAEPRKGPKGAPKGAPVNGANLSLPERVGIQFDLAFTGHFNGLIDGGFNERTATAIKSFQKSIGARETGALAPPERAQLAANSKAVQERVGWAMVDDKVTGAQLGLPTRQVPRSARSGSGTRWSSAQGQIQIETFRIRGPGTTLADVAETQRTEPPNRKLEVNFTRDDFFILSGLQGLKKFYVRAQIRDLEVRGVTILYDQATEGIMATVATATAGAFQGFPDAKAALPGMRRAVEYATAIVVSAAGDLLAPGRATEECRSIVAPGLGHAERVAADPDHDLALLRLYGARNLVPAALSGESKGDALTLFGVGDPLAQAGDTAVTGVAARRFGQGVEPVPKLGFSGAAAVDVQGRFAGVVNLKSPAAAGGGSILPQGTIVPAETVRGFLTAQGVTLEAAAAPAADRAAIEKSVMRIICVRR
jgi:hypothetical protein